MHENKGGKDDARLVLLSFNDVYRIDAQGAGGGLAALADRIAEQKTVEIEAADVLVLACGDLLTMAPYLSLADPGAHVPPLLDAIGVTYVVPGNHEFDRGAEVFCRRMRECRFPWLCTNVFDASSPASPPEERPLGTGLAFAVHAVGPFKVGLIGLCTPDTPCISAAGRGVRFGDTIDAARRAVDTLQKVHGVDAIVALTHLSLADDRALASSVGGIDVIVGGHDHDATCLWIHGRPPIIKAGSDCSHVGRTVLRLRKGRAPCVESASLVPNAARTVESDVARRITDIIADAGGSAPADDSVALAVVDGSAPLDSTGARLGECSFANLLVDLLCDAHDGGVDLFLVNGGSLRGNRAYAPGTAIAPRDLRAEIPFPLIGVVLALTGRHVRAVLENALERTSKGGSAAFVHLSRGWRCVYDPRAPCGSRVASLTLDGREVVDDRPLRVGMNAYLARGGDGNVILAECARCATPLDGRLLVDVLAERMRKLGRLEAPRDRRWVPSHEREDTVDATPCLARFPK